MEKLGTSPPLPGLCSLQHLPEPCQSAFRRGSAHQLPGKFLPAKVDWFTQIFMLPFWLIYALPLLAIPPVFVNQLVNSPEEFVRISKILERQSVEENAFTLVLLIVCGVLLIYFAWIAWDGCSSFIRTWRAHQLQRRGEHGFGIVLMDRGLVARLIDNINGQNCIWLPQEVIADIFWQQVREEGAKHSRWVHRTRLCYVTEHKGKPKKYWLTLKGQIVQTGYPIGNSSVGDSRGDRFLFEQLDNWWRSPELSKDWAKI